MDAIDDAGVPVRTSEFDQLVAAMLGQLSPFGFDPSPFRSEMEGDGDGEPGAGS